MKKIIILTLVLAFTGMIKAQDNPNEIKTIFNNNEIRSNGGYGGLMINYSKIANRDAVVVGGKGGWIINHSFTIGLAGYGFFTEPMSDINYKKDYEFTGGYGGLLLEPILGAKYPIHVSFPIIIGAGGAIYTSSFYDMNEYDYMDKLYEDSDAYFVIEPGVEIEFNIVKFMRLALLASYRYTSDVNLSYQSGENPGVAITNPDFLHGWNFGLALKFGKF